MLGSVGVPELIIIFTIALIIFGPRKLPELGKSLGKSLAEFKRASNELKNTLDEEIRTEERRSAERQEPPRVAAPAEVVPVDTVLNACTDHNVGSVPRQHGSAEAASWRSCPSPPSRRVTTRTTIRTSMIPAARCRSWSILTSSGNG